VGHQRQQLQRRRQQQQQRLRQPLLLEALANQDKLAYCRGCLMPWQVWGPMP
jgi:hypothetical protein